MGEPLLEASFLLPLEGTVAAALLPEAIIWHRVQEPAHGRLCSTVLAACMPLVGIGSIRIADVYAVEVMTSAEKIRPSLWSPPVEVFRLVVHTFSVAGDKWVPQPIAFCHVDKWVCEEWAAKLKLLMAANEERPKRLLVFINPYGGQRRGVKRWQAVRPLFERAAVELQEVVTEKGGHAGQHVAEAATEELERYDGIVVVGGDGFFNEVLNGLLKNRHTAPPCPRPTVRKDKRMMRRSSITAAIMSEELGVALANTEATDGLRRERIDSEEGGDGCMEQSVSSERQRGEEAGGVGTEELVGERGGGGAEERDAFEERNGGGHGVAEKGGRRDENCELETEVMIGENAAENGSVGEGGGWRGGGPGIGEREGGRGGGKGTSERDEKERRGEEGRSSEKEGQEAAFSGSGDDEHRRDLLFKSKRMRIGIIPAGSTDCIVVSINGSRCPTTAALHIILGDRMPLDIVRVSSWRDPLPTSSLTSPSAASASAASALTPSSPSSSSSSWLPLSLHSSQDGSSSLEASDVRYAASFVGYGFYGDVANESERLRWMGPSRYDLAGLVTYLRHCTYEVQVEYLHLPDADGAAPLAAESDQSDQFESDNDSRETMGSRRRSSTRRSSSSSQIRCTTDCFVCSSGRDLSHLSRHSSDNYEGHLLFQESKATKQLQQQQQPQQQQQQPSEHDNFLGAVDKSDCATWQLKQTSGASEDTGASGPHWRQVEGRFHSVGGAVMSCRNDKAPDGVAASAHLADGCLHLILVKECSRPQYLLQLLHLSWKGADPFIFDFVQVHKTPAFTVATRGRESVWNVDGEIVRANELAAQVFRGLVDVFARGPSK